jgi:hypothetical protein
VGIFIIHQIKEMMRFRFLLFLLVLFPNTYLLAQDYSIVDTRQTVFYNNTTSISAPEEMDAFYGQDANYNGNQPSYTDNGDGTVTDNVTGLMWSQTTDLNGDGTINVYDKLSQTEAVAAADTLTLGGYDDWRLPTIKEQYSLILFDGTDPSGYTGTSTDGIIPFIDDDIFGFGFGDVDNDERLIDAQYATTSLYVSTTMMGDETMFGVNFADGRIKGYPTGPMPGETEDKQFYMMFVRGNPEYGINDFVDNGDGTITDNATGLMWKQDDSEEGMEWETALNYAENHEFAGYSDWRLPNAKELQSIVDYSRSPATSSSAAIDPIFNCSQITDEGDETNYPFFWTSTTHANLTDQAGSAAAYLAFGEALGFMEMPPESGTYNLLDVHGAGSQRSDPKTGDPADYPYGNGPQGDVIRIFNYVRLVRDIQTDIGNIETESYIKLYPNPAKNTINISSQNEIIRIEIFNSLGQNTLSMNCQSGNLNIDISAMKEGMYFIKSYTQNTSTIINFIKL